MKYEKVVLPLKVNKNKENDDLEMKKNELIPTETTVSGFVGDTIRLKGIIILQVKVGKKVRKIAFFMWKQQLTLVRCWVEIGSIEVCVSLPCFIKRYNFGMRMGAWNWFRSTHGLSWLQPT
ncbi:unnamed protein product [Prunus armeniaca]